MVTELPHMVNPDNLALKIAELVNTGKLNGIADIRDNTSARTGQQLVIVLKRDAQPRVVLNNLYKHTQLQDTFGCNMLALVDDVPRTLRLDQFISYWITHQIEVIQRRTQHRLDDAEARAHIYRGLVKALDALDEVIALIRRSPSTDEAREGLKTLLEIDDLQANAILDMQLRRLAALERQRIIDQLAEFERIIADLEDILARPERQRTIVRDELAEIVDKYGDERRTEIIAADGDLSNEDLIPDSDVVVTITRGGYAKRTTTELYRVQKRGGKGVRGATLRTDDEVGPALRHHQPPLDPVLHQQGPGLPRQGVAAARGRPGRPRRARRRAAVLPARRGDRPGAGDPRLPAAPYLLLATKRGLVKKTALPRTTRPGRPASSRSTSATTTTS